MKYPYFNIFFLFIVGFNLITLDHITDYRIVAKPLIMATLLGFYISKVQKQSYALLSAMIFALLGDAFLLFTSDDFFIIGLSCFLLMQILYTTVFLKDRSRKTPVVYGAAAAIIICGLFLLYYLWPALNAMQIPVALYTAAITVMVISAILRSDSIRAYPWVVAGVLLFMVSDGVLAVGKFREALPLQHYIVMLTYMLAQYFIVTGMAEHHKSE
ncbi:MAG: lysoplasmalogenase [Saprospiraceae bacterium]|nr:lysoplasmalogenase [Saprospiraceae bacterium]